eukprot:Hpha_TRINITY_DN16197_c3_g1::TRINITY_DN16197_c3_g1_i1::g.5429::m.5429
MSDTTITTARVLMGLGSLACAQSIYKTFENALNPKFQAPEFKISPNHSRYHAFRGGCLAVAATTVLNGVLYTPAAERVRSLWNAAAVIAVGYFGGWWIPRPLLNLRTPHWVAELVHLGAALLCSAALFVARPAFVSK